MDELHLTGMPGIVLEPFEQLSHPSYVGFNVTKAPLDNKPLYVRRSNYALDVDLCCEITSHTLAVL